MNEFVCLTRPCSVRESLEWALTAERAVSTELMLEIADLRRMDPAEAKAILEMKRAEANGKWGER